MAAHIPAIWTIATPEAVLAAHRSGCTQALHRILGPLADSPELSRAADLSLRAALNAPTPGRPLYAALRSRPVPEAPVPRLYHAATLLREHRGDSHTTALIAASIGGQESHALAALAANMTFKAYGRLSPLTPTQLAKVLTGLHTRGLITPTPSLTPAGRTLKTQIESLTDTLAAPAYEILTPAETSQLQADLTPIAATIKSVGY
ncbi:SCO6745 family protein [Kribbella sp. DT2]|uniref:SCO6745 family protein n=1 Tax=Kribbella sp. DT2 TaxID=3393427 RepID=UPI003CEC40B9